MEEYIMLGYECLTELAPFIAVYAVFSAAYRKRNISVPRRHTVFLAVFAVYMMGVFYFTGAGTLFDAIFYNFRLGGYQVNLNPFSRRIDTVGYLLNIVLFIPFGLLVPIIWTRMGKIRYILLYGAGFSLIIELSQLLNNRSTDVDDLILNTLGALIGYGIFEKLKKPLRLSEDNTGYFRCETAAYVAAMFLGRFFLFDDFAMAKLLYGF